jgi:hypothetical protein
MTAPWPAMSRAYGMTTHQQTVLCLERSCRPNPTPCEPARGRASSAVRPTDDMMSKTQRLDARTDRVWRASNKESRPLVYRGQGRQAAIRDCTAKPLQYQASNTQDTRRYDVLGRPLLCTVIRRKMPSACVGWRCGPGGWEVWNAVRHINVVRVRRPGVLWEPS